MTTPHPDDVKLAKEVVNYLRPHTGLVTTAQAMIEIQCQLSTQEIITKVTTPLRAENAALWKALGECEVLLTEMLLEDYSGYLPEIDYAHKALTAIAQLRKDQGK